jgi:DNA-binding transcriptional MerR regulator
MLAMGWRVQPCVLTLTFTLSKIAVRHTGRLLMMQIGDLAARAGTTTRTIRYYEELGIIEPDERTEGGFRLYSETQLRRLGIVQDLKVLGMGLDRIRALFAQTQTAQTGGELAQALAADLTELQGEIDERLRYYEDLKVRNERALAVLGGCVQCAKPLAGNGHQCLLNARHPDVPELISCADYRPTPQH